MTVSDQDSSGFAVTRRIGALVALFALFLQGSTGGHMLLVEHSRCAEHGELVHGEASHRHAAQKNHADRPGFERDVPETFEDGHGHCAPCADRRDGLPDVDAPRLLVGLARVDQPLVFHDAPVVQESGRFRIAPKNSPPA